MSRTISIGVVGPSGVGKTSIIQKYINERYDVLGNETPTTRNTQVSSRVTINNTEFQLELWDTVGQERFNSVSRSFYHDKSAIVFVYDVTDVLSFEKMKQFVVDAKNAMAVDTLREIIGNKTDCENWEVQDDEVAAYASKIKATARVLTATDPEQVKAAINDLVQRASERAAPTSEAPRPVQVANEGMWVDCC